MEKNKTNYSFFGNKSFSFGPTQNVGQNVAFNMKKKLIDYV
jgi:hypothetical protein